MLHGLTVCCDSDYSVGGCFRWLALVDPMNRDEVRIWRNALSGGWPGLLLFALVMAVAVILDSQ